MSAMRQRYKFADAINKQIEALYILDNWHGILALLADYAVITAVIIITLCYHWFYLIALVVIASRQRALATIQHEASHFALAKNRALNYWLGSVFSGHLIFQNFSAYSQSHVQKHHAFLGDNNIDPDYNYHIMLGLYNQLSATSKNKIYKFFKFLTSYLLYLVRYRIASFSFNDISSHLNLWLNMLLIFTLIYFGYFKYYLAFWLVPMFSFYLIIGWYIELAEHYPLVGKNNIDLYMSRNRFGNWFESLFFSIHNENFHLIHHLKPRIPFWKLKQAHQILMQDQNYKKLHQKVGGVFATNH